LTLQEFPTLHIFHDREYYISMTADYHHEQILFIEIMEI
jgi:succinyl-CoA synthetase beta subunit